jgi:hypothetical protein
VQASFTIVLINTGFVWRGMPVYGEIILTHLPMTLNILQSVLDDDALGKRLPPDEGRKCSKIYGSDGHVSFVVALDIGDETLILARWLDNSQSAYHVERTKRLTPSRLCEDINYIYFNISGVLRRHRVRPQLRSIRLFEDTGPEIGVQAVKKTWRDLLRDEWTIAKVTGPIVTVLTACALFFLKLDKPGELERGFVAFGVGLGFTVLSSLLRVIYAGISNKRMIQFKFTTTN